MILRLLRAMRLIGKPAIDKEQAFRLAREECERRGWPWQEPIGISDGFRCWKIVTHVGWMDSNVWMSIDHRTGEIMKASRSGRRR